MITPADADINREIPIEKIKTVIIEYDGHSSLDQMAQKYLGDARYWWVIAKLNNLWGFWRIAPGSFLMLPDNVDDVLDYF